MKYILLFLLSFLTSGAVMSQGAGERWFPADNPNIGYMGRIDFANPKLPRFWNPGIVVRFRFRGSECRIVVNDQVPDEKTHNSIVIEVAGHASWRMRLTGRTDTITVRGSGGDQLVSLCKATEGIGWMELAGVWADALLPASPLPDRKIELIGNSITCGFGDDTSNIPCGQGQWFDQSNAWISYGALTARALKAQWHLTSVSGIGLIHSCCDMTITMPQVFDRMDNRGNQGNWDFARYQPDVVTVCLGQNDGIQDSTAFCGAYVKFVRHIRDLYPRARIVLLTSPMGNAALTAALKRYIHGVIGALGDRRVSGFAFSKQWTHGCYAHPDRREQAEIAQELTKCLRGVMKW